MNDKKIRVLLIFSKYNFSSFSFHLLNLITFSNHLLILHINLFFFLLCKAMHFYILIILVIHAQLFHLCNDILRNLNLLNAVNFPTKTNQKCWLIKQVKTVNQIEKSMSFLERYFLRLDNSRLFLVEKSEETLRDPQYSYFCGKF